MNIIRAVLAGKPGVVSRCMFFMISMLMAPFALAQDADQVCEMPFIESEFKQYVTKVDQAGIQQIQTQLNTDGYGRVATDGILGIGTRQALQRLCRDFEVKVPDNFAERLVALLAMSAEVSKKYPGWRELIKTDVFKNWLKQKPEKDQANIASILQSGPAQQIVAILDGYTGAQQATKKKQAPAATTMTKKPPQLLSGPTVFYRWQAPEDEQEPEADDSGEDSEVVPVSDEVLNQLGALEGIAYPNQFLFGQALEKLFDGTEIDYKPYRDQIVQQARNGPVEEFYEIQLSGDGCGCSRNFSSLVVGFYPFWLAAQDEVQSIDFSLLDRMAFYALSLNQEGNIQNPLQWSDTKHAADFINAAHKHRVAVDLSFYATEWQSWSGDVIENAAANVVKAVVQKLHSSEAAGLGAIFPFMQNTSSAAADGVILHFDNYVNAAASDKIIALVTQVAQRLKALGSDAKLAIMLGMNMDTVEKQPLFEELSSILLPDEAGEAEVDHVFLFLQEPTTYSKKILRRKIEDDFRGSDRKSVLRKVIPVISPAGHENDTRGAFIQFTDDLIYFQDNFAGIGFWPLPLGSDQNIETIKAKLVELFKTTNDTNLLGGVIEEYLPWLCEFACPNRWLFRISFDLLVGLLLIYAVLAIWICRLRSLYRQYLIYFLGLGLLAVLIMLVSLACDPFWQQRADRVIIVVFLLVLVGTVWRYVSKATQPPLP